MISALALAFLLFFLGFLPLLGGPRYEAALLCGLVLPTWTLVTVALSTRRELMVMRSMVDNDALPRRLSGAKLVLDGLTRGSLLGAACLAVAVLHGIRLGPCEPLQGIALFVLGPIAGGLLAAIIAALVGIVSFIVAPRRGRLIGSAVVVLAFVIPLASAASEVVAIYQTPVVYAYDQFVGYFAGPLYDATAFELKRLLSFRVQTLGWAIALAGASCALSVIIDRDTVRVGLLRGPTGIDPRVGFCAALFAAGSLLGIVVWTQGDELGHRADAPSIRAELGRTTARKRCHVHFARNVSAPEATRIARECEGHLNQLGRYFEVAPPDRVDVYLFESADQKRRLIGAGRTNVAKPWRREVYIRPQGVPHSILGHELAHVVTASFGQGPFRIAGPLGGLVPDPGRVEGFAEAAAVREYSEGTLREWAAAMKRVGQLPSLEQLFRLSFFGSSAARSYTAAGAFVDYLREKAGPDALRAWYGGAPLSAAAGAPLGELEAEFLAYLDETEVPSEVLALAEPRFSRPGVLERRCPHAVDRLLSEGHALCGVQPEKARRLFAEAVALDATHAGVELVVPRCEWWAFREEAAEKQWTDLLVDERRYSPQERRAAWENLGDLRWKVGQRKEARLAYEQALELSHRRDVRRQIDVKLWGLQQGGLPAEALRASLAPGPNEPVLPVALLVKWQMTGPHEALAAYLLSRMALFADRPDEARMWASNYEPEQLPVASVEREAARTQMLIACQHAMKTGDPQIFKERLEGYLNEELSAAERLEALRLAERCLDREATK